MIEIKTDKATRTIEDAEAVNGMYGLDRDENILSARIFDTSEVPSFALMSLPTLEKVVIEDGVKTIGQRSFQNDYALKSVEFPESLESVEYNSFENCPQQLIDTFPHSVKQLMAMANEKKQEADRQEQARRDEEEKERERRKQEADERLKAWKQRQLEEQRLAEQREAEERERQIREREEGNLPRTPEEEMLVRIFSDELSLYDARDRRKPLLYRFDISVPFSGQPVTIKIQLAEKGSRKRHDISLNWLARSWDIDDFDDFYLSGVAGFQKGLESIGMKTKLCGKWYDVHDGGEFHLYLNGAIKKSGKDLEHFLESLQEISKKYETVEYSGDDEEGLQHELFKEYLDEE